MQIRVITLEPTCTLVGRMAAAFPNADVAIQRGIDVRGSTTDVLFASGLITPAVAHTLEHGRKWHHEASSKGAVGLAQANRLALEEDLDQPLLLLEADCVVRNWAKLQREVAQLLAHADKFDMAVFGMHYKGNRSALTSAAWLPPGFKVVGDKFWLMHCVLYTPGGRRRVAGLLRGPLDMQIDSLYGAYASMRALNVVGQISQHTARQAWHLSDIQVVETHHRMVGMLLIVSALAAYLAWYKCRAAHRPGLRRIRTRW